METQSPNQTLSRRQYLDFQMNDRSEFIFHGDSG